jgi:hypothetical protein
LAKRKIFSLKDFKPGVNLNYKVDKQFSSHTVHSLFRSGKLYGEIICIYFENCTKQMQNASVLNRFNVSLVLHVVVTVATETFGLGL